jgi:hypothetical protein
MFGTKLPEYLPAKTLADFELDEKMYTADFEVSARWDGLARELERLALLGIGAYGFFITKSDVITEDLRRGHHFVLPAIGLIALGVSAGCALICTHLNSLCLGLQVDILRLVGRMQSGRWNAPNEQDVNKKHLTFKRADQKRMLWQRKALITVAVGALLVGAGATVCCFILTLVQRSQPMIGSGQAPWR